MSPAPNRFRRSGVYQLLFTSAPKYRGVTVFVDLLPDLEQDNRARDWDRTDPLNNSASGSASKTATILPVLVCPSDVIPQNPVKDGSGRMFCRTSIMLAQNANAEVPGDRDVTSFAEASCGAPVRQVRIERKKTGNFLVSCRFSPLSFDYVVA